MSDNIERLLGRIEEKLDNFGKIAERNSERLDTVEKVQGRMIWTGSGVGATLVLLWTIAIALVK